MVDQEQEGGVQDADPKGGLSNAGRAPGSWRGQLEGRRPRGDGGLGLFTPALPWFSLRNPARALGLSLPAWGHEPGFVSAGAHSAHGRGRRRGL